jgi:hypothetical protein
MFFGQQGGNLFILNGFIHNLITGHHIYDYI